MTPYFQSRGITIYHGDSRDLLPALFADQRFDLLLTDPPYNVAMKGKVTKFTKRHGEYSKGDNDHGPDVVDLCLPHVERAIVFPGVRMLKRYPDHDDMGAVFCPSGAGIGRWGFGCIHPILYYGRRPKRRGMWPTSFSFTGRSEPSPHPCPKPVKWMDWAIKLAGEDVETIIDPFAGAGTTGVAAVANGKRAVLIDWEESYCELAAKRIEE